MSTQPEALWLADALDELDKQFSQPGLCGEAAAELRRLHEENERLRGIVPEVLEQLNDELCEENKEMLAVLKRLVAHLAVDVDTERIVRAAIKKAEGKE
jgi:hypothetical protein